MDWEIKKIGSIATLRKEKFNPLEELSTKYLGLEHINQDYGTINGFANSNETTSMKTVFKKGDVLFGKLRPYLKKYWLATFDGVCATEILPIVSKDNVNNKFLFYILQQDNFIDFTVQQSFGTKMPRASWKSISDFDVLVPTLAEQQKIADILSTVDEQIDQTNQLIKKTKELKKGLMQKLLTRGLGHTEFKQTEVGNIPVKWEVKALGDLGGIITGNTPKTSDKDNYGDNYLWVSPADLGESKYISRTNKMLSEKGFNSTRKISKGSILVTCIGSTIGKTGIASADLSTNQQINSIVCDSGINNEYLYYAINFNFDRYKNYISTQAVPIINKSTFSGFTIGIPELKEQKKIASILSLVDDNIEELKRNKLMLHQLKKGLMQQLLTGKIRVNV